MTPDYRCGTIYDVHALGTRLALHLHHLGRKLSKSRYVSTVNLRLHFPARGAVPSIGASDYAQEANP